MSNEFVAPYRLQGETMKEVPVKKPSRIKMKYKAIKNWWNEFNKTEFLANTFIYGLCLAAVGVVLAAVMHVYVWKPGQLQEFIEQHRNTCEITDREGTDKFQLKVYDDGANSYIQGFYLTRTEAEEIKSELPECNKR